MTNIILFIAYKLLRIINFLFKQKFWPIDYNVTKCSCLNNSRCWFMIERVSAGNWKFKRREICVRQRSWKKKEINHYLTSEKFSVRLIVTSRSSQQLLYWKLLRPLFRVCAQWFFCRGFAACPIDESLW